MAFFDQIKGAAQDVAKVTGDQIELAKLSTEVKGLENKQKKLFAEIGEIIYDTYLNGDKYSDDISNICIQIDESNIKLEELEHKILACKNQKKCFNCGTVISVDDQFCNKCGAKQEVEPVETVEVEVVSDEQFSSGD